MSIPAAAILKMVEFGLTAVQIGELCQTIDASEVPDTLAKRRAYDRERKRQKRVSTGDSGGNSADISGGTSTGIPPEQPSLAHVENNPLSLVPSGKAKNLSEANASSRDGDFEAFWGIWPDKRAKGAARKAYPAARRKASQAEILAGVPNVTETHAWQGGLHVHASTWLNGERWADPPEDHARAPPVTGGMLAAASDEIGYRRALERINGRSNGNHGGSSGAGSALPAPAAFGGRLRAVD